MFGAEKFEVNKFSWFNVAVSSSNRCIFDLHPKFEHELVVKEQAHVDSYWETLQFCYPTADSESAKHGFPGFTVPEVCVFFIYHTSIVSQGMWPAIDLLLG